MKNGWSYLDGRRWEEVTRDERFFCQRLYTLATLDPPRFVRNLNRLSPGLSLDEKCEWEVGFEVCFFRDLRYLRGVHWNNQRQYSLKRTFDLCLFSENRIVIIEAKAQQSFESDPVQWEGFVGEPELIRSALGRHDMPVSLLTIASGLYLTREMRNMLRERFGAEPVAWSDLAEAYDTDAVLARAESIFERPKSGVNNEVYRTGEELLAAWHRREELLVGRQGGAEGALLREDVSSGAWRSRLYETRKAAATAPNSNWFHLEHFGRLLRD